MAIMIGSSLSSYAQVHRMMTFNIRYDNPKDGDNKWDLRKEELVALLKYYQPSILGLQEALPHQLKYIDAHLSNHAMIGISREGTSNSGEFTAIFYDTSQFQLLEESTFWLSETPDKPSKGWDAALNRICTYGIFQDKNTQNRFLILNTHYDHKGEKAREMSSKLLLQKIKELNKENLPLILMGDFNSIPKNKPIQILKTALEDASSVAQTGLYGPLGTFNGFDPSVILKNRIDYIFVKGLKINSYRHIDDRRKNNLCISDHLPVMIEF